MTLCVTYGISRNQAITLSDSLLTTTRKTEDTATFLPSNQYIAHQTPRAVKIHIVSQSESLYAERYDVLCAIAGNVSLGLQSLLHLDAYLKGIKYLWYDHIKLTIEDRIYPFWEMARDQSLEMSFALNDHKGRIHLFELKADEGQFNFYEVEDDNGILLSVIGDRSSDVRAKIMSKVNLLSYQTDISESIHVASASILREEIEDSSSVFIGGVMQGAVLNRHLGEYLVVKGSGYYFRGAKLEDWDTLSYPIMDINTPRYEITRRS